jgi:hypothetical protein
LTPISPSAPWVLDSENQPIKIRGVLRNEPHANGIGRHVFGQRDDGLNQWNGFLLRPTAGMRDAAGGAVAAHDGIGDDILASSIGDAGKLQGHSAGAGTKALKFSSEINFCAGALGHGGEAFHQSGALDDQVGLVQLDGGRAAVGK